MRWYTTLVDRKNLLIKDYVDVVRGRLRNEPSNPGEYNPSSKDTKNWEAEFPDASVTPDSARSNINPAVDRPSEYLRERCPLRFGGTNCHSPDEV